MHATVTGSHTQAITTYDLDGSLVIYGRPIHQVRVETGLRLAQNRDRGGADARITLTSLATATQPPRRLLLWFDIDDLPAPRIESLPIPEPHAQLARELAVELLARTLDRAH